MEKVRPWCGHPSDRGRLKNEKNPPPWAGSNKAGVDGTVRYCQSKEASMLWSHNEKTREFSLKSFVKFVFIVPGTATLR